MDLAAWLSEVLRAPVTDLRRLTGGASRETWSFCVPAGSGALSGAGGARRLVLRRDPPGSARPAAGALSSGGMALEAAALAAAARAGVPVPELVAAGDGYLITAFVDGETIGRRLLRDAAYAAARSSMAVELGRTLALIHAIAAESVPGLSFADPVDSLRADLDAVAEPLPSVEVALRWLDEHRPAPVAPTVVHGDFRTGNLIISPAGLEAVLDWELVHRGDPREDLGWLCVKCWRFGSPRPAGGFGTVAELLDGYESVAGWRPDPGDVHWWQVHRTAWWAIGCRAMAERHLSGAIASVELAAIGRRVCEQEHDLLLALGLPAGLPDLTPASGSGLPRSDLHGRPSAADLADAVAGFIRDEVMAAASDRIQYLSRVASNVLDTVVRELRYGARLADRHDARLAALGLRDTAAFATAIRSGALDAADPAVRAAVRAMVTDRLAIANPRYFALPDAAPSQ